jgi:hypothetical protein
MKMDDDLDEVDPIDDWRTRIESYIDCLFVVSE